MLNRKKLIGEIASDFFLLKRRMMSGHKHPLRHKITPSQGQLMFILIKHKDMNTSEIAKLMGITTSAATQLIDGLVQHGFVIRESSDEDRRAYKIKISDSAKEHMDKMKAEGLERMAKIFEVLEDDELNKLFELSHKIVTHALEGEGDQDAGRQCDHA